MQIRTFGIFVFHPTHRDPFIGPLLLVDRHVTLAECVLRLLVAGPTVNEQLVGQFILQKAVEAKFILGNGQVIDVGPAS